MLEVSVVITTYKRAPELLERAILSVLSQTYPLKKLVVVDDSPSDYHLRGEVEKMVGKYADRNTVYIQHPKNMGACVARNTGAAVCECDYIAFLDDDDEWLPEKIEKQVAKFSEGVALVYCGQKTVYDGTDKSVVNDKVYRSGRVYDELIKRNFIGSTSFPLIRKSVFDSVGGFDPLMQSSQDYDLWLRITKENEVDYVEEPLVIYHIHDGEQITKNPAKRIAGLSRIIEKNMDHLAKHKAVLWQRYTVIIKYYVANGQKKEAMRLWRKCCLLCPLKFHGNAKNLYSIVRN